MDPFLQAFSSSISWMVFLLTIALTNGCSWLTFFTEQWFFPNPVTIVREKIEGEQTSSIEPAPFHEIQRPSSPWRRTSRYRVVMLPARTCEGGWGVVTHDLGLRAAQAPSPASVFTIVQLRFCCRGYQGEPHRPISTQRFSSLGAQASPDALVQERVSRRATKVSH